MTSSLAILYRDKFLYIVLSGLLLLALTPAAAQEKKDLQVPDYALWSKVYVESVSRNGNYISYRVNNASFDSLFVRTASGKPVLAYGPNTLGFFEQDAYLSLNSGGALTVTALKTGKQFTLAGIRDCKTSQGKILCLSQKDAETVLEVFSLSGRLLYRQAGVAAIAPSPDGTLLAITATAAKKTVSLLRTDNWQSTTLATPRALPKTLLWSENGHALYWKTEEASGATLSAYSLETKTLAELQPSQRKELYGMELLRGSQIKVSPDGKRLQFRVRRNDIPEPAQDLVQVWHTTDNALYPNKKQVMGWEKVPKQIVWEPGQNRCTMITDTLHPHGGTFAGGRFGLCFSPYGYFAEISNVSPRDIYLTNTRTGERKCIIKAHDGEPTGLLASPEGNYIAYRKEASWFVYNIAAGTHTPLSLKLKSNFGKEEAAAILEIAGWDVNDACILLYDAFDLFKVAPDGSRVTRLTFGREKGITYRLVPQHESEKLQHDVRITISGRFDLSGTLLLRASAGDNTQTGYFLLAPDGLKKLFFGNKKVSSCAGSPDGKSFVWIEESYGQPPTIVHCVVGKQPKPIFHSNAQQDRFYWGNVQHITYKTQSFGTLTGSLYYPANYKPGTLYPMVVHVYEKQSDGIHNYIEPSRYNSTGFNVTNLVTAGYFVLLPDIQYATDKAGDSAVECVLAALDTVAAMGIVDDKRIGLIGHSFGGYETDYIITKTGRFACAVAGAAITDYLSHYLSIARNQNTPNYNKSEHGHPL